MALISEEDDQAVLEAESSHVERVCGRGCSSVQDLLLELRMSETTSCCPVDVLL